MTDSIHALLGHREWAVRLARSLVSEHLAEDAAQDALTQALQRPPRGLESPRSWLGKVTLSRARDRARAEQRRGRRERSYARPEAGPDDADLVAQAETQRRLVEHVLALDEPYRQVLLARYFDDQPPRAIARREGVSPQVISNRLFRAHALLRARLESEDDGRDWRLALAPLALGSSGGTLVLAKGKLTGVLTVGAALLGGGWLWLASPPKAPQLEPLSPRVEVALESDADAAPGGLEIEDLEGGWRSSVSSASPAPRASLAGTVFDQEGLPMGDVLLVARDAQGGEVGRTASDAEGSLALSGLPTAKTMALTLSIDGVAWHAEEVQLADGQKLEREWILHRLARIVGTAVDGDDIPLANAEVLLAESSSWRPSLLRRTRKQHAKVRTDLLGRFEIEDVEPGRYLIGPTPGRFAPLGEPIEILPGTAELETTVRCWSEPAIAGKVVYPDGTPAEDVLILGLVEGYADSLVSWTRADGRFRFENLAPGTYKLIDNSSPDEWCIPETAYAQPGDQDIELVLQPAGRVVGQVVRSTDGGAIDGWWLALQSPKGERPGGGVSGGLSIERSSAFDIESLDPGLYDLSAYSDDQEWFGMMPDVAVGAGAPIRGLVLEVHPSARLRVLHPPTDQTVVLNAYVGERRVRSVWIKEGDTVGAVPPGRIRVVVTKGGEPWFEQTVEVVVGREMILRVGYDDTGEPGKDG